MSMATNQPLNWKAILKASAIVFVISTLLSYLYVGTYGFYIGFTSQGNMALVQQQVNWFAGTILYMVLYTASLALITFWRDWVLLVQIQSRPVAHLAAVAGVVVAGHLLISAAEDLFVLGYLQLLYDPDAVKLVVLEIVMLGVASWAALNTMRRSQQSRSVHS